MNAIAQSSAMPQSGPQLDNRRVLAGLIDLAVVLAPAFLIGFAAGMSGADSSEPGLALTAVMTAWALYYYFALESGGGQTLGKKVMKLRVVRVDGAPLQMGDVAVRTVLRIVDGMFLYLVGLVVMLATGKRRGRLGDLAAKTMVVSADAPAAGAAVRPAAAPAAAAPSVVPLVAPEAPGEAAAAEPADVPADVPAVAPAVGPAAAPDAAPELEPFEPLPSGEPVMEPEPVVLPEPVVEPEPGVEPEPVVEPEPGVEPEPIAMWEPEPADPEPLALSQPAPVEDPESVVEPEPVVQPEPGVEPEPIAMREPEPVDPEPVALSQPAPVEDPESVEVPEPVVEPEPIAVREPVDPEPVVLSQPEPVDAEPSPVVDMSPVVDASPVVELGSVAADEPVVAPAFPDEAPAEPQPVEPAPLLPAAHEPFDRPVPVPLPADEADEQQPAGDDEPHVVVKSVETVSAIDLVMGVDEQVDDDKAQGPRSDFR